MNSLKILVPLLLVGSGAGAVRADPVVVQPLVGGLYGNGNGVNSQWVQVDTDWRGQIYGSESWGTGIWGLADANLVLELDASSPDVVNTYTGVLDQIGWADKAFLDTWTPEWGAQQLVPFFTNNAAQYQDNYAVRFSGFISITDPGLYNFGVLYDDGFRFNLYGDGIALNLSKDGLNARNRLGFDQDLELASGLYGFDLIAYERLEAGVVNLSWIGSDGIWTTVPTSNLFPTPIPEPSAALMMLAGLGLVGWASWKRLKTR